jgi:hypothetical protein
MKTVQTADTTGPLADDVPGVRTDPRILIEHGTPAAVAGPPDQLDLDTIAPGTAPESMAPSERPRAGAPEPGERSTDKMRRRASQPRGEPGVTDPPEGDRTIVRAAIHPAIGIARVGNSPAESFIGPEVIDPPPAPPGSYRDSEGALKRQAARFRIYGYNAAGEVVGELTPDWASIRWGVHVANRKASWYQWHLHRPSPQAGVVVRRGISAGSAEAPGPSGSEDRATRPDPDGPSRPSIGGPSGHHGTTAARRFTHGQPGRMRLPWAAEGEPLDHTGAPRGDGKRPPRPSRPAAWACSLAQALWRRREGSSARSRSSGSRRTPRPSTRTSVPGSTSCQPGPSSSGSEVTTEPPRQRASPCR